MVILHSEIKLKALSLLNKFVKYLLKFLLSWLRGCHYRGFGVLGFWGFGVLGVWKRELAKEW